MIATHSPSDPEWQNFYRSILMDTMEDFIGETRNGFMLEIINRLSRLINEENEVALEMCKENMAHSSKNRTRAEYSEEYETNNLPGSGDEAFEATKECLDYTSISREDKLKRIVIVGNLLVDLMELNLAPLLMKDIMELKKVLHIKDCQPLIASVLWRSNLFLLEGHNKLSTYLIKLYIQGIKLKLPTDVPLLVMRILALVAEVSFIIDYKNKCTYPYFGKYCQKLAQEIGTEVSKLNPDGVSTALSMIHPTWLKHLVIPLLEAKVVHEESFKRIKLDTV